MISGYRPISPGVPHTLLVGFLTPQDCLVVLDVPALQHAVCGGVPVMVQQLRLAEVHCMFSLEHMIYQGGCLDVSILQYTVVFTDMLLEAPPSLANVLEHSTQGMEYTTPLCSSTGTGSFGRASIWRRVHRGWNTTQTPRGIRTHLIASDSPQM